MCEGQGLSAMACPHAHLIPQPQDLRDYVLQGSVQGCLALEGSVGLSNSVSRWVQVMVLSRPGPSQRAQVLDKFIHVAQVRLAPASLLTLWALAPFRFQLSIYGDDITMPWPCPDTLSTHPGLSSQVLNRIVPATYLFIFNFQRGGRGEHDLLSHLCIVDSCTCPGRMEPTTLEYSVEL